MKYSRLVGMGTITRMRKAKTTTQRQRKYREKLRTGENRRIQLILPLEIAIKVDYLTETLHCNKTKLFADMIMDRWHREGEPVIRKKKRKRV